MNFRMGIVCVRSFLITLEIGFFVTASRSVGEVKVRRSCFCITRTVPCIFKSSLEVFLIYEEHA